MYEKFQINKEASEYTKFAFYKNKERRPIDIDMECLRASKIKNPYPHFFDTDRREYYEI